MATHATVSTPLTPPRLPSLDPSQAGPDGGLRAYLIIFDDDAGREVGATCAVLTATTEAPAVVVCRLHQATASPFELDPTLPLADALCTLLAAKYAAQEDPS